MYLMIQYCCKINQKYDSLQCNKKKFVHQRGVLPQVVTKKAANTSISVLAALLSRCQNYFTKVSDLVNIYI